MNKSERRLGAEKALDDIVHLIDGIQWVQPFSNSNPSCPECGNYMQDGHTSECQIALLLAAHNRHPEIDHES